MLYLNTDQMFINDLTVDIIIGVEDWERAVRQAVVLSLSIVTIPAKSTNQATDLHARIDYKLLISKIVDFCQDNNFIFLDHLVIQIEQLILSQYQSMITGLEISAKKLFPLANTKEVGVKIARTYTTS